MNNEKLREHIQQLIAKCEQDKALAESQGYDGKRLYYRSEGSINAYNIVLALLNLDENMATEINPSDGWDGLRGCINCGNDTTGTYCHSCQHQNMIDKYG